LELFQPFVFVAGDEAAVTAGAVLSIFSVTVAVAVLPALSVTDAETISLAPSAVTVWVGGQEATPEPESKQEKFTVTLVLFQPLAFGVGDVAAITVGGVLSMLTITLVVAVLPALSVAVPEMI
jgi:hypothetical protein